MAYLMQDHGPARKVTKERSGTGGRIAVEFREINESLSRTPDAVQVVEIEDFLVPALVADAAEQMGNVAGS